ncbi:MAG: toprim domain-containing protein [Janthinobacterium lividum]
MHNFLSFVAANGIIPPEHLERGRWVRCRTVSHPRKKNGSIKLADDGQVGWCQDYAVHSEPVFWRADDTGIAITPIDHAAIARRNAERRVALVASTMEARTIYAACRPLTFDHDYLTAKGLGVGGCTGLRVDDKGWLVIPMLYNGKILSLQRISPDGEKKFHLGATTKGAYYAIERQGSTLTALVEGFATGLTIFNALPNSRVMVAFKAGNLPVVAHTIKRYGMGVVCADNDWETAQRLLARTGIATNPGIEHAQKAADILGVGVAYPTCAGSDWNDFAIERMDAIFAEQDFSFSAKRTIFQIQAKAFAEIKTSVMREARLLRPIAQSA